jgi:hypothetical protein
MVVGYNSASASNDSVVVGNNVSVTGRGSLIVHPRHDGVAAAFAEDETLNIYGVLLGRRWEGGYAASL